MTAKAFNKKTYRDDELEARREGGKTAAVTWTDPEGNSHTVNYAGKGANVATVERMAQASTVIDPAITERKAELEESAETAIVAGNIKDLDTISKTLFGRRAISAALEKIGISVDDYAEILQKSRDVGLTDDSDALASRRHFTTAIEKIGSIDAKKEEVPMQVLIVIGDAFKEVSDEIDDRNGRAT